MSDPILHKKAPDFKLPNDQGNLISLNDFRGKMVVLYFYPKDNTPTCTQEACDFRDHMVELESNGAVVLGVSQDKIEHHKAFAQKYKLPFFLLSDVALEVMEAYGVWKEKSMFGKRYMGIERSTFLIDEQGVIRHIWRKVRIKGHVEQVLNTIKTLKEK